MVGLNSTSISVEGFLLFPSDSLSRGISYLDPCKRTTLTTCVCTLSYDMTSIYLRVDLDLELVNCDMVKYIAF